MQNTPNANRLHIAIFGKRNVGKSSLINALTNQEIALVSNIAGTTTDPVYKPMELLPLGPVVFIDTAGIDDEGEIGELRIKKTKSVIEKTDLALLVFSPENEVTELEKSWYSELKNSKIPVIGVINKNDSFDATVDKFNGDFDIPFISVSSLTRDNIDKLKGLIIENTPIFERETIIGDAFKPGDVVMLIAPQDIQAPKGRLILPQVQTLRDVLDYGGIPIVVTYDQLIPALDKMKDLPDLVITDSQIFEEVNKIIPKDVPLTSFSILMARYKGDLDTLVNGANAIGNLKDNDKILIAEACTHHALKGDIGREKLPNWLKDFTKADLDITVKAGVDFDSDLAQYKLVIHCGACMFNRAQMLTRLNNSTMVEVPITNYGTAIAYMKGILPRVTEML